MAVPETSGLFLVSRVTGMDAFRRDEAEESFTQVVSVGG